MYSRYVTVARPSLVGYVAVVGQSLVGYVPVVGQSLVGYVAVARPRPGRLLKELL